MRRDFAELREDFIQLFVTEVISEVLDVDIGEVLGFLTQLALTIFAWDESSDEYLLTIEQHTIDLGDGTHRSLFSFKVHKTVTLRVASFILGNFAAQNVSKCRESVVHGLVVNGFIKILDENVANTRASKRWITLRPHDANRSSSQNIEVHGVQSPFSYQK